jgi:hypothetical protein
MISETALHDEFWTLATDSKQRLDSNSHSAARSKMLWRSLGNCKDYIHTFLSYQPQDLFHLTVFIYPRLCYVFVVLAKLVFLDSNGIMSGLEQLNNSDADSCSWNTMNVAKEAEFQELGQKVLDKFTTVVTDFVGVNGQRDAMFNLASAMKLLMTGYEQQMTELQTMLQSRETSNSVIETPEEYDGSAVNSTPYSSVQGIGTGVDGDAFDMAFSWDSSANTFWDDVLDNLFV